MNDIENSLNSNRKNKNSNLSSDNDDIIKQLSQITSNDDKSFESSLISKNIPKYYDINNYSKDINISKKNKNIYETKNLKHSLDEENPLINNKYFPLNQKLKYLCSLIQIFNINIKKYDDLKDFNKYFSNDILKPNQLEPINILFDIISELIFYIQREIKNNNILMKELKISKNKRTEQENLINKLKTIIKEKENEIKIISTPSKNEMIINNSKDKEINELKEENNQLYRKINNYKNQIKKLENNNFNIITPLNNSNHKNNCFNYTLSNDLYNRKNFVNLYTLNNSYDNQRINLKKKNYSTEKNNNNIYFGKTYERNNKYININQNFSPTKTLNNELSTKYRKNMFKDHNNNEKNIKDGSIISNLKILLKEINNMLNAYNSNLDKINTNNNITRTKNIKYIYEFVNEMNNKLKKLKNLNDLNKDKDKENDIDNDNNQIVYKKSIQVNTSKWKFRKKSINKNRLNKLNDSVNLKVNIQRKNTSSTFRKDSLINKLNI